MKVLMLGWEFPPFYSGGLGIASKNIAEALTEHGAEICFAVPFFVFKNVEESDQRLNLPFQLVGQSLARFASSVSIPTSISSPYISAEAYEKMIFEDAGVSSGMHIYGQSLFAEIERYAAEMEHFVKGKNFDILHAHDWITFHAALKIKQHLNIPFVAHVHATEVDRTGNNPNPGIFQREKESLEAADYVVAVSNYTKQILVKHYGLPAEKIHVAHNGIEPLPSYQPPQLHSDRRTVLFLGRLTVQKGPDWFLKIAKKVLEERQDVQFIIGGVGDMLPRLMNEIIEQGLSDNVFCLGFLNEVEREKAFALADAYVMPSVSEPFGLSAIEAAQRGIPVLLSHQSGVKEVISHSLCADFWDTDKMANYVLAVLEYPTLQKMLSERALEQIQGLTWREQVKKIFELYRGIVAA